VGPDVPGSPGTFDALALDYESALADPWRERFADSSDFFIHQKCRAMLRDLDRHPVPNNIRNDVRNGAVVPRAPLALDVGCGRGPAVAFLRDRWRVIGTDVSADMIKQAPARLPLAVQEPFALPFPGDTFDVVFAFCVYHHLARSDHARHLRELVRVARPGGRVFVFEHNPFNPVTRVVFHRAPIDRGCRMIAPADLRTTFRSEGLTSLRTGYVLFVPQAWSRRTGALEDVLRWLPVGGQYYIVGRKAA
jgi:SAM-dependent methyltransferase